MNGTILLVEDNKRIMEINSETLTTRGYRVLEAQTVSEGRELFVKESPDLIVLDIMLPDGNGLALCEEIRGSSKVPILFVTALGHDSEIVTGLQAGGDDYLPKPYDIKVLVERVNALLRRGSTVPEVVNKGTLRLETFSRQAFIEGANLGLTGREFDLLSLLAQNEDRLMTTEHLYEKVWGQPLNDDANSIRVVASRLRNKIQPSGYTIHAMRGKGYIFTKV